ncbi:pentatricopeptide repeat-containing protein [Pyrus ussuriensis x Pyrus communis]|uniref:Pentatricopeptide repeat-containing protein n=1 Tax=Pyrus ussuriensis x Pyrus communis TaxID=2448454 RepID=A0A5N5H6B8_9ROSA|nr:pentatricopeptide repeat-containing protein [Pyrus ussuriensis x Pyrus communis]
MVAPLSLHHIRPPFNSDIPLLYTKSTTATAIAATTFTKNPIEPHPSGLFFNAFTAAKVVTFWALEGSGSLRYAHFQRDAIFFYQEMILEGWVPDRSTFPSLFKSCGDLHEGKQLHCHSTKFGFASDSYIQNTLMNMYVNCGCFVSAQKVFDKMTEKSVDSWATMIDAYAKWDRPVEALKLFGRMECENVDLNELARDLFDKMPEKNLFSWNIMINGHVEDNNYYEAFVLFHKMQLKGEKGDEVMMVSLLLACSHLGALELGKWLHVYIEKENIKVDVALGTTLVDMYAKCGSIDNAWEIFRKLPKKDCGQGKKALEHFHEMQKSGLKPDAITFVGVLAACSHAGLVDEGILHFNSMSEVYGIQPTIEHYGGMVDISGEADRIAEAEELTRRMQIPLDRSVLGGLLGSCKVHGKLEAAERVAQQLLELDPNDDGAFWDEAKRIRALMAERIVKKAPGCCLIEVDGIVHEFVKGDSSHPQSTNICDLLEDMISQLKKDGYVPEKSEVVLDIHEEEETAVSLHSEKLAIAFGLISTKPRTTIRVVKNLRVCSDCHNATKLLSKVYDREIIERDRNCCHRLRDGSCSCNDFW